MTIVLTTLIIEFYKKYSRHLLLSRISLANERLAGTLVFIGIVAAVFTVGAMLWNCAGMTKAQLLTMCGDDIEETKGGV